MTPSTKTGRGFGPVLTNAHFRSLWSAQLLAQTSQHAILTVQMALIELLTGSTVAQGLVILAFTLPGVIFSPIAGVVVDRFSKKTVLVVSNASRALLALSYVLILTTLHGTWQLVAVYAVSFATASLSQFFYPAEAATIPMLVGDDRLLAANSLFNLTMVMAQAVGLLALGPLIVKAVQVQGGFIVLALLYLAATALVARLPHDVPNRRPDAAEGVSHWLTVWHEAKEGWQYVSGQASIKTATAHMVTVNTLVMVLAMIVPGFAARVLGLEAQDMVIVFAPAFAGMLLATGLLGRWGQRLRRTGAVYIGLGIVGLAFATLGGLSLDYQRLMRPILHVYPHLAFSLTSATMVVGFVLGLGLSGVNIMAQTTIQEESPASMRGRVFSVLFMMMALVGIPPMMALGEVADRVGIPRVFIIVGCGTILVALASYLDRHTGLWPALRGAWGALVRRWPATTQTPDGEERPRPLKEPWHD